MERNHTLGLICGYYLSRFDDKAYDHIGYSSYSEAHRAIAATLDVPPSSIKNWRDEFDPVFDNDRQGWHKRLMAPSRVRTIVALGHLSFIEMTKLIDSILANPDGSISSHLIETLNAFDDEDERTYESYGLRGRTGIRAEEAFVEYHERTQLPAAGTLHDRRYDQCGFDFEIEVERANIVVEVKGIAGTSGGVTFTKKEWEMAREYGDRYYLALVRNIESEAETSLFRNPASQFRPEMQTFTTVQVQWSISSKDLHQHRKCDSGK